jgi:hypothetical protein
MSEPDTSVVANPFLSLGAPNADEVDPPSSASEVVASMSDLEGSEASHSDSLGLENLLPDEDIRTTGRPCQAEVQIILHDSNNVAIVNGVPSMCTIHPNLKKILAPARVDAPPPCRQPLCSFTAKQCEDEDIVAGIRHVHQYFAHVAKPLVEEYASIRRVFRNENPGLIMTSLESHHAHVVYQLAAAPPTYRINDLNPRCVFRSRSIYCFNDFL